ncbi:hypothetical protein ILYODFUR_019080 [Ilyodon furcidens]|uniref:Uncharacterized protein n=1 Tax=Ilyodon furcidens TaxID=33524 RepID=A0ABV0U6K7_9TELE
MFGVFLVLIELKHERACRPARAGARSPSAAHSGAHISPNQPALLHRSISTRAAECLPAIPFCLCAPVAPVDVCAEGRSLRGSSSPLNLLCRLGTALTPWLLLGEGSVGFFFASFGKLHCVMDQQRKL